MSMLIAAQELSYRTPDGRTLFDTLSIAFAPERTGLIGRNGAGKSTLLRLLAGELRPLAGEVVRRGSIGVFRQALAPAPGASIAQVIGQAEPLLRLRRLAAGEGSLEDAADADWTLEARLDAALADVGLGGVDLLRPADSLSGGELTRAALAGLMADAPDLLLLDEPTNNLDAAAREHVCAVLSRWRGGAVVASHDRGLLRRMDRIVELGGLGVRIYGGGYDLYRERRAEEAAAAARGLDAAEQAAVRVEREVQLASQRKARKDAAGKRGRASAGAPKILLDARQDRAEYSSGRANRLAGRQRAAAAATLEQARERVERVRGLTVSVPATGLPTGRTVLVLDEVGFGWPGRPPLLSGVSLQLVGPERVAVTGPNGSGKSTLLRLIVGDLEPVEGKVRRGVRTVQLDQRASVLEDDESLLANFLRLNPGSDDNRAHAALARFLFRAGSALRTAGELSGGERLRAALACVLGGDDPPGLLVLDEPTNHLDLDSVAAIEAALADYDGALIVVSHDADFLKAVGVERRLELEGARPDAH